MAARDDDAADEHRTPRAQIFIREPSADERRPINARSIGAHNQARVLLIESKSAFGERLRHVQKENRLHSVEAEAFPHLCKKERGQPARVSTDPASIQRVNGTCAGLIYGYTHVSCSSF